MLRQGKRNLSLLIFYQAVLLSSLVPESLSDDDCVQNVKKQTNNLNKYIYMRNLQNANDGLFYKCLINHPREILPVVYTPTVGEACQNYGKIPGDKRGLVITINDRHKVEAVLSQWPSTTVAAIVVTDGERILGLGDLGANGMGIPVGKMAIYTAFGGVFPDDCLPITLDVGTNNEKLLKDKKGLYVGLKQRRVTGPEYDELVDEFMEAVVKVFGPHTLIQFEDFANDNAFRLLNKYRGSYTMFNDDIQGTAAVVVAGMMAANRITGAKMADAKVLFVGAGTAALGIANLIVDAMEGSPEENRKKIYMRRSTSLLSSKTCDYEEGDGRRLFCHEIEEGKDVKNLVKIIRWMKPTVLIGVTGKGKQFTKNVLKAMAEVNEHPIIFPLSNPTSQSECTAEEAYKHTQGKCLFAGGSPFDPVTLNGVTRSPQQCNNAYIFPGVALAITVTKMSSVPDHVFLLAAQTLATKCTLQSDLDAGSLFPTLDRLRDCSLDIATDIAKYAFENNLATLTPLPQDLKAYLKEKMFVPY